MGSSRRRRCIRRLYGAGAGAAAVAADVSTTTVTTTEQMGRAMLAVAKSGYPKRVLERGGHCGVTRADSKAVATKIWVEVSRRAAGGELAGDARRLAPETEVLAVVKANAYGHGRRVLGRTGAGGCEVAGGCGCGGGGCAVRRALEAAGIGATSAGDSGDVRVAAGGCGAIVEHGLTPVVWTESRWSGCACYSGCGCMWRWTQGWGGRGCGRVRS